MKKIAYLISLVFMLNLSPRLLAQESISVVLLDVNSLDLRLFLNFTEANLENLSASIPIIMSITLNSAHDQVLVKGWMNWESPKGDFSGELFHFVSEPINVNGGMLYLTNKDIGDGKPMVVDNNQSATDADLIKENAKRGKLSGTYYLNFEMTDLEGNVLASAPEEVIIATNPAPTFSILDPDGTQDLAEQGFQVQWQDAPGFSEYTVVINDVSFSTYQEAISGRPMLNKQVMGNTFFLSSDDFLRRLIAGGNYYLGVFASQEIAGEGVEYYGADNNSMSITVAAQNLNANQSNDETQEDKAEGAPSFNINEPSDNSIFKTWSLDEKGDANFTLERFVVSWGSVRDITKYKLFIYPITTDQEFSAAMNSVTNLQYDYSGSFESPLLSVEVNSNSYTIEPTSFSGHSLTNVKNLLVVVYAVISSGPDAGYRSSNIKLLNEDRTAIANAGGDQRDYSTMTDEQLINNLMNLLGDSFNGSIVDEETGEPLTREQLISLLTYLQQHPERIINSSIQ